MKFNTFLNKLKTKENAALVEAIEDGYNSMHESENMNVQELATKHNVDISVINDQLEKGVEVEMEHTNDNKESERIALDHLDEDPMYYTKLIKAGL